MNTYDAATGNRTHNPLLARVALRPLDTSTGGHNSNFNDECNGDCAITDMLNFKMMTECIMCILIGRDPLKNPLFHTFQLMGPVGL